ncbi:hypothetical protein LX32DRAFT_717282 [Colletotrichum zoysiae]|uniref:C2H2-type domain-containing protein n=1 Tax=Colletotrichum zoysiae TaxID=1216348 RepID=A0AAD9HJW0_9PEZI|nr:hypothetical protein LX32DRAFT_717282 [Colletotrichum zoysiae]
MDNEDETEPSGPLSTMSSLAHSCRVAFSKLRQDLPSTEYHGLEPEATDQAGRFSVWALNIGALQRPGSSSSLDSRLEKAERMKNTVVSGLQRLEDALKRANEIALGNIPNRTTSPTAAEEIIKYSVGTAARSTDERDHNFTTEINELFNNIQSCITHLFTLSTMLRQSHPRGFTLQQGPQSLQSDPGPLITNAKDKFPKLKQYPWLAERIGRRTALQIDYIRYRQDHHMKLARVDTDHMQDELTERATTKATSVHDTIPVSDSTKQLALGSSREESVYTVTTSFAQTAVGETYSGRIIPQLTDMWLDGRQLGYGEPMECPYCRTIQIIKDRYHWKHHVYRDLQTYVCSFEHCSEGPFQTSHEWFQHEIDNHRRQWRCVLCRAKYKSASALESHFTSQHPSVVSATQRKVMLKACEFPLNHFDTDSCLLCDDWRPPSDTEGNSNKFRSHLAKHYQDLACEAIPLAIEGLEIKAAGPANDVSAPNDDESSTKIAQDGHTEPFDKSTFSELQEQPSSSIKPASSVMQGSDEDQAKMIRKPYGRIDETRIPARLLSKQALKDLGYSYIVKDKTFVVSNNGKRLDQESFEKLLNLSEKYKRDELEVGATDSKANSTIEELSDLNPVDQDSTDSIAPSGFYSVASGPSRSPGTRPGQLTPRLINMMQDLSHRLESSEGSDKNVDEDKAGHPKSIRQGSSIGKRTITERSGPDRKGSMAPDPDYNYTESSSSARTGSRHKSSSSRRHGGSSSRGKETIVQVSVWYCVSKPLTH